MTTARRAARPGSLELAACGLFLAAACGVDSAGRQADASSSAAGSRIVVPAGGDLQRALDQARPNDVIVLEAGATFRGPFTLPRKPGSGWITVQGSASDDALPAAGTRMSPSYASTLPKLEAADGAVLTAARGAHHFRLVGLEIRPSPGARLVNLVILGSNEDSLDALPEHITIERCYLHGDPVKGTRRGVALNSRETAIVDSYLSDFKEVGADSQAIAGWNGPGPFRIENNTLEGAGENILFGGADPRIKDLVPSDITIRRNLLRKPLAWKSDEPEYAGTPWTVKNLLELKNARRVLIEGNRLEHNWVQSQTGFAVLFTVRNQEHTAPWSVVEDVTFRDNVVSQTSSGINVLAHDDNAPSAGARGISILNNLFDDVGGARWGGDGRLFQILDGVADLVIGHNTAFHTGNIITVSGRPNPGFAFRDNLVFQNQYGVIGDGTAPGSPTLQTYFPGALFRRNVVVGAVATSYPSDNFFPRAEALVGFMNRAAGDYRLSPASPYKAGATDGTDVGADVAGLGLSAETKRASNP
ncbi:MAG: hypothetical protein ACHQKZ_06535 [Solirubrobacterales bacterium]|jgi:hypothetical protein